MERLVGTTVRGIRCPIIKTNDNLRNIVVESVINASKAHNFELNNKDVIAITESVVARAQGNYASIEDIALDLKTKFNNAEEIGIIFPILSRNRFAILLRGFAKVFKKVYLMLSYPSDEVGNELVSLDDIDNAHVNPYSDVLDLAKYRELFGYKKHRFTGIDYVEYYESLIKEYCDCEIIFANNPRVILNYTKNVLTCDIHSRERTKRILKESGANIVLGLDDVLNKPVNNSGFNELYGLLGSNKATEDTIKLFPRASEDLVSGIQKDIFEKTGKLVEVMVYGDGAFKDPVGHIWELADPVVSPFHTEGLKGTPNELKLKYLADNKFAGLKGVELKDAIKESIKNKDSNLVGKMETQGTTPRQITDLLGSLSDLTSGSGDKGTPVILIQGYFDNYSND